MEIFEYGGYKIEIEFNREKYGLFRWDYDIIQNGEVIAGGCDRNSHSADTKLTIIEFLIEDDSQVFTETDEYSPELSEEATRKHTDFIKKKFNLKKIDETLTEVQKDELISFLLNQ